MNRGKSTCEKICMYFIIVILVFSITALTGCLDEEEKYPDAEVTIIEAEARTTGTQFKKFPIDGYEFLWVRVEIRNLNERKDLSLNAWYFELVTEEGGVYTNPRLEDAPNRIIAGANITFWVVFEIPMEQTGDILRFDPSWFLEEPFVDKIPPY